MSAIPSDLAEYAVSASRIELDFTLLIERVKLAGHTQDHNGMRANRALRKLEEALSSLRQAKGHLQGLP